MAATRAYVEHVAIHVRDIDWHMRFFREVLGMEVREVDGEPERPRQVWTRGGLQFISNPDHAGPEGRLAHLGVMAEDVEAAITAAHALGVESMPGKRDWLRLPDGLVVELLPARAGAVAAMLAIDPRG